MTHSEMVEKLQSKRTTRAELREIAQALILEVGKTERLLKAYHKKYGPALSIYGDSVPKGGA